MWASLQRSANLCVCVAQKRMQPGCRKRDHLEILSAMWFFSRDPWCPWSAISKSQSFLALRVAISTGGNLPCGASFWLHCFQLLLRPVSAMRVFHRSIGNSAKSWKLAWRCIFGVSEVTCCSVAVGLAILAWLRSPPKYTCTYRRTDIYNTGCSWLVELGRNQRWILDYYSGHN